MTVMMSAIGRLINYTEVEWSLRSGKRSFRVDIDGHAERLERSVAQIWLMNVDAQICVQVERQCDEEQGRTKDKRRAAVGCS